MRSISNKHKSRGHGIFRTVKSNTQKAIKLLETRVPVNWIEIFLHVILNKHLKGNPLSGNMLVVIQFNFLPMVTKGIHRRKWKWRVQRWAQYRSKPWKWRVQNYASLKISICKVIFTIIKSMEALVDKMRKHTVYLSLYSLALNLIVHLHSILFTKLLAQGIFRSSYWPILVAASDWLIDDLLFHVPLKNFSFLTIASVVKDCKI
jgi:hypothetical protein